MVSYSHQRENTQIKNESEEINMFTSLDILVIAFMVLTALTLLSLCLMFLLKNKIAKTVCFYVVSVLGLYIASIGLRIGIGGWFTAQIAVGALVPLMIIGAVVLERVSKGNEKLLRIARILSAAALVIGFLNAIL